LRHRIHLLHEQTHCFRCGVGMALVPGLFSSRTHQIVFVTGAVGLGMTLARIRWSLGKLPYDMDQFVLDLVCFWLYAWISRILYFQCQIVEAKT
jgi:hypothetical protein